MTKQSAWSDTNYECVPCGIRSGVLEWVKETMIDFSGRYKAWRQCIGLTSGHSCAHWACYQW